MDRQNDILDEVRELINGEKKEEYGIIIQSFQELSNLWGIILGKDMIPGRVALCMIALKLSRESYKHKRDNIVDIIGYAYCLAKLYDEDRSD